MKIGVIQASSKAGINQTLYEAVCDKAHLHEVINFGCFPQEEEHYSYIDISILVGLLLTSGAVDFIVTGCSSGQGMMLACNNMPGVICGYTPTPQDAYLFGRINDGNAVSVPLGLNFGWAGEINLKCTLESLFSEPFGTGYPPKDADRKKSDTENLKQIKSLSHISLIELLNKLDRKTICQVMHRKNVVDYILENGTDREIVAWIHNNLYLQK